MSACRYHRHCYHHYLTLVGMQVLSTLSAASLVEILGRRKAAEYEVADSTTAGVGVYAMTVAAAVAAGVGATTAQVLEGAAAMAGATQTVTLTGAASNEVPAASTNDA